MLLDIQNGVWNFHGPGMSACAPSLTDPDIVSFGAAASSFVVNGVTYNANDTLVAAGINMKIFGLGSNNYNAKGKLYYLNIYEGKALKRELIPVRRNTDNIVGLYDTVTKSFFTDMNSNNFTAGNDTQKTIIKHLVGGK